MNVRSETESHLCEVDMRMKVADVVLSQTTEHACAHLLVTDRQIQVGRLRSSVITLLVFSAHTPDGLVSHGFVLLFLLSTSRVSC